MNKVDDDYKNRLHLNIIINFISRIYRILNSLTVGWVYEQNKYFWFLDKLYRQLILKLLDAQKIIINDSYNEKLMDIIVESELLHFKNLYCYHDYILISGIEELVEWMLDPILRKIESLSSKYNINEGMYYLIDFPLDLEKAKQKLLNDWEWKWDLYNEILSIYINEFEFDILLNKFVKKFKNKNKYLYKKVIKKESIYFLYDNIVFDRSKYIFINIDNEKEYSIKKHWNYDKLIDILLKYYWKYVTYEKIKEESWMEFFKTKVYKRIIDKEIIDKRTLNKKITDIKCNLVSNIEKNVGINKWTLDFIKVNNWLKITFK